MLHGVKWWTSGACDPRCAVAIFMGKTDPRAPAHLQQSMVRARAPACARGLCVGCVRPCVCTLMRMCVCCQNGSVLRRKARQKHTGI